jgi:hypothetical protein
MRAGHARTHATCRQGASARRVGRACGPGVSSRRVGGGTAAAGQLGSAVQRSLARSEHGTHPATLRVSERLHRGVSCHSLRLGRSCVVRDAPLAGGRSVRTKLATSAALAFGSSLAAEGSVGGGRERASESVSRSPMVTTGGPRRGPTKCACSRGTRGGVVAAAVQCVRFGASVSVRLGRRRW